MRHVAPRLSLSKLVAMYGGVSGLARALDRDRAQVDRWFTEGVPLYSADRVAIALGMHPIEIWPEWYGLPELMPAS